MRGVAGRDDSRRTRRHDHINMAVDEFGRHVGQLVYTARDAILDDEVPFHMAKGVSPCRSGSMKLRGGVPTRSSPMR